MSVKKVFNKGYSQAQIVSLALAFVGEHKDLFEKWLKEKKEKSK